MDAQHSVFVQLSEARISSSAPQIAKVHRPYTPAISTCELFSMSEMLDVGCGHSMFPHPIYIRA